MGLAALLMSGAMQGQPVDKLVVGADALSQPNGGAPLMLAQSPKKDEFKKKGGKKKKSDMPKKV
jgi:hypothetical protein